MAIDVMLVRTKLGKCIGEGVYDVRDILWLGLQRLKEHLVQNRDIT